MVGAGRGLGVLGTVVVAGRGPGVGTAVVPGTVVVAGRGPGGCTAVVPRMGPLRPAPLLDPATDNGDRPLGDVGTSGRQRPPTPHRPHVCLTGLQPLGGAAAVHEMCSFRKETACKRYFTVERAWVGENGGWAVGQGCLVALCQSLQRGVAKQTRPTGQPKPLASLTFDTSAHPHTSLSKTLYLGLRAGAPPCPPRSCPSEPTASWRSGRT